MSTSVDNRIVQMTFDNKQFEAAIKQSMNSLKDLDKTIEKAGAGGKAGNAFNNLLERVKEFGKNISLSSIADSVESIKNRFSSLGIVGMTVIQNLTNSAMDFVKRGLSSINDALFGGGWQRASNLEQALFRLNAMVGDADEVARIMEDVDKAVTGTAFGLDEAAVAASMFAATGMKSGKEMYNTLLSIAGMASTAGVSFDQISNIMIDAASQGVVMNDTLTRLAMNGIPAAILMSDKLGISVEELKKKAKKGEIAFSDFAKVMSEKYGDAAQKANETFSGALSNMQTAFKRITEPFFTSFRTGARDIFNTLRDGINNFGEAIQKSLPGFETAVTNISSGIVNVIKDLSKANYIVTDLGKKIKRPSEFKKLGYVITGTLKGIIAIFNSIKKAFDNVFGGTATGYISSFIDLLFSLEERFVRWAETQTIVEKAFTGLFRVIQVGIHIFEYLKDAVNKLFDAFRNIGKIFAPLGKMVSDIAGTFLDLVDVTVQALNKLDLFGRLASAVQKAFGLVQKIFGSAFETILGLVQDFGKTAIDSIDRFMDLLIDVGILGWIVSFSQFIDKVSKLFKKGSDLIETVNKSVKSLVKIPKQIVSILNEVRKSLKAWQEQLKATVLLELAAAVYILSRGIKALSDIDGKSLAKSLSAIVFMFGGLMVVMKVWDKIFKPAKMVQTEKGIRGALKALVHEIKPSEMGRQAAAMIKFSIAIYILTKALASISQLSITELGTGLFGITVLMGMMIATAKLLSTNDKLLERKRIEKGMLGLIFMAISIKIMASALAQLAGIPWDNLDDALAAMTLILGEVVVFSMLMSRSTKGLEGGASAKSFILFAISMKIMASALEDLANIDWDSLQNALAAMGLVLFELTMFSAAATALGGMKGGVSLIAMAAGIYIIANALSMLSALSWEQMNNEMNILITLIITLTAVMLAADFGGKGAAALVAVAIALNLMIIPLMVLSGIPIDNLAAALLALVTTLTVVGIAMAVFSAALVPMLVGALALTAASVAIGIFAAALMALGFAMSAVGVGLTGIATGILAIYTVIKRIFSEIISFIGGIISKIAEFVSGSGEEIDKSAHDLEKNAESVGAKVASGLKSAMIKKIKKSFGEFRSGGLHMISNLISGVKGKISNVAATIGQGIQKAKSKVAGFVSDFFNGGKNLVSGIARGISNGASSVISAAGSIAKRALSKFKSMLGISSPSKEFAKASRWIPEGIVVGINKTSRKVDSAIEKLSNSTVDPFSDAMRKAFAMLQDDDNFNPIITPVLDLSEVRKDASRIGSIFGKESTSLSSTIGIGNPQSQQAMAMEKMVDKIGKIMESSERRSSNITNHFTVNGNDNPEQFVNSFINTLDRELKMRAV